jgi:hypothetical protein
LGFLRSHSGWIGNEVADSAARFGREIEKWFPDGREIPMYIAKSRLCARARQRQKTRLTPVCGGASSLQSLASTTGYSRNPLLGDSGAFRVSRRTECVYNQLRVGCATFAHGFRIWGAAQRPVCPNCGGKSSCAHYLLQCPVFSRQREKMVINAKEEAAERHRVAVDRAEASGRRFPKPPRWSGLELSVVSKFPFAALQYIAETRTWLDDALGGEQGSSITSNTSSLPNASSGEVRVRAMRSGWERV